MNRDSFVRRVDVNLRIYVCADATGVRVFSLSLSPTGPFRRARIVTRDAVCGRG